MKDIKSTLKDSGSYPEFDLCCKNIKIGVDVVSIERIKKLLQSYNQKFTQRFLIEDEFKLTHNKPHTLAGFFAAKEACAKAIGTGIGRDLGFLDILISKDHRSCPYISLVESKKAQFNIHHLALSITHDANLAIAVVVVQ